LTNSAEFQSLFQRGKRIDRPSCVLLWTETCQVRRVGFAVSRQLGRAVDRNRVRRRLRAAYRAARGLAPTDVAIVVVGKKRVLDMKFSKLVDELQGAFSAMTGSVPASRVRP
jgi:ribonuclease P protein component